jgi:prephenate dehydratase
MRLGYLGPEGTWCAEALRASAPAGLGEPVPFATVYDTVSAVADDVVARALVPIENSLEGAVNATLDALAVEFPSVQIVGETVLAIRHCLIAAHELDLTAIEAVVSHPQAHAQCGHFLRAELPQARAVAANSTADAVRTVAAAPAEPLAAVGTPLAAELYGGIVLRAGIEDDPDNATRFVWLAGPQHAADGPFPPAAEDAPFKTSIVFAGAGDASPGWLVRCLSEFAFRGVNLTKIESRPRRGRLGHYFFLVDAEGRVGDEPVAGAVDGLHKHCEEVRVLGSYPAAA